LTKRDVNDIQDAINDWTKKNGKPASATSKMQYKITFQRFLKGYGKSTDNQKLIELAKFGFTRVEGKKLESENILSEEEIEKIIACCIGIRDKALVAIIYELGARVGEIQNCKIGDVKDRPYGFHINSTPNHAHIPKSQVQRPRLSLG
jgi:integrase